jgi:hypothetical protein
MATEPVAKAGRLAAQAAADDAAAMLAADTPPAGVTHVHSWV